MVSTIGQPRLRAGGNSGSLFKGDVPMTRLEKAKPHQFLFTWNPEEDDTERSIIITFFGGIEDGWARAKAEAARLGYEEDMPSRFAPYRDYGDDDGEPREWVAFFRLDDG